LILRFIDRANPAAYNRTIIISFISEGGSSVTSKLRRRIRGLDPFGISSPAERKPVTVKERVKEIGMNKRFYLIGLAVAILAGLLWAGTAAAQPLTAGQPQAIDIPVTVHEFIVELPQTTFPANTPLHFIFTNSGTVEHETVLEKAGDNDAPLELDGEEAEVEHIQPGMTKDATWTITEPGEYQIACHMPGHYEGGMVVRFTVTPPAAKIFGVSVLNAALIGLGVLLVIGIAILAVRRSSKGKAAGQPVGSA
jgi:plastocyanin